MSKNTDLGSLVNYIKGQVTGRLNAPAYTSATAFTGTIAGYLGFDTSGNILTSSGVGIGGSGTTNYVTKFTSSGTIGNSLIFDNGTNVGIGTISAFNSILEIRANADSISWGSTSTLYGYLSWGTAASFGENVAVIKTPASTGIIFQPAGTEKLRLDSSGRLGLGTNSPSVMFQINSPASTNATIYFGVNGTMNGYLGQTATSGSLSSGAAVGDIVLRSQTNLLFTSGGDSERMRLDSSGRFGLGTTSISGYAMTITGVDGTNYSPSSLYKIIARFVNNTTENRGIGIGYHTSTDINTACIYSLGQGSAAFPQATLAFGVYNRSTSAYTIKFLINQNTVYIGDIPSSDAGRSTGELYRDALGYVKIVY